MDETRDAASTVTLESADLSRFAESYASFNRIINSLQRQYIELKDEFADQNSRLADANQKLVEMTRRNLAVSEFLNSILYAVPVGIIAVDERGRITQFNPAATKLLAISPSTALGQPYRDIVPPGTPVHANALRAAESGKAVDSAEKKLELSDGSLLSLSVSTAILRDDDGRAVGAVEVFQDLTRLKKIEQELSRLSTLAALGEMAATIAHEVRNPLAGIGGFASLLKRDLNIDDPRQKLVDKIIAGVESLNRTVTTLLNYSRFEEVNKEDVLYREFLLEAIDQFRADNSEKLASIDLRLENEPVENLTIARIDPMLIRQLFFNLLTNATDANAEIGSIQVTFRRLPREEALAKYAGRMLLGFDETVLETVVRDSGIGIDEKLSDKIFSPFFTTKVNGTGLGLAVSWKIAKAHGGEIVAENHPDGGARFLFLIPTKIDHVDMERS
ncbi:MAG: ATP-binding protein [candidate division Zixibacteria bacterium]|nr:ATP-binding protein [candidate division Zixibacteria bacterium]